MKSVDHPRILHHDYSSLAREPYTHPPTHSLEFEVAGVAVQLQLQEPALAAEVHTLRMPSLWGAVPRTKSTTASSPPAAARRRTS